MRVIIGIVFILSALYLFVLSTEKETQVYIHTMEDYLHER